jgi:site-specific recombinase XerD
MNASHSPLASHIQAFFTEHLCHHKRVSPQTLASCRDSFRLLLTFVQETVGIEPSALCVADLDAPTLLAFLDHLEEQRGNSIRSRNIRLSALRSFFRFVALRDPESVEIATRVLAIPIKREDKKLVGSLTRPEIDALIAAPDQSSWIGRRDHALLLTMYNSGARVSEITSLKRERVAFGATTFLELHGKGRKEGTIPLWPQTREVLKRWFRESHDLRQSRRLEIA